jgi:acyl transferase domain-containing protein/ubiquinone/menaquinone biosynthesis C-methylase UbiE
MGNVNFSERIRKLSPAKLILLAEELQSRLEAAESARREPIAILGIGCRFPGGADDPQSFWRLLCAGGDAVREVPRERWDVDSFYDPDPAAPGKMTTRWGGFLTDVDQFDAQFFGIAPREAASMDPQQRLLLETAWQALESAGIAADKLAGSATGVFVGISGSDYYALQMESGVTGIDTYLASGTAHSVASGRLAYVLGVQGPTFSVDTACSSSLVALHAAVQSLRGRECSMALAGGVNLLLSPVATIALSKASMMAPDGRCKAFDARADGFVRGEGAAMIVLKRLSDAISDGDPIMAVIRGSAINQDGRSNGLTAPNGPAQEAVIRAALENAGVAPLDVGYVETHGTGTSLGDPIEVQALSAMLGRERDRSRALLLGSVKTNIGHLESAAGIAGLVKAVLAIRHGQVPPHLHLRELNPMIPWGELPVAIPTTLTPWGENGKRIAGVSSFGFSGTNAHVILGEAPARTPPRAPLERPLHMVALSARSEPALRALAGRVASDVDARPEEFTDLCHTAAAGRSQFKHRLAIVARSPAEASAGLREFAAARPSGAYGHAEHPRPPGVAFLFTGQGSQYSGMGRQMYDTQPAFREALDRCAALLVGQIERPLTAVLFGETDADRRLLSQTAYTQPALFALEYALAELWRSWGVVPAAVMGHSVGEYAATCVAGACSLEDALRLVAARGRLMQTLPAGGAMAAVFADQKLVEAALIGQAGIAAYNGPQNVVIAGPASDIERVLAALERRGINAQPLDVSHAFHSASMDPILDEFARIASTVAFSAPHVPLISNVTGDVAGEAELAAASYWRRHVRQPVQFARGMQTLRDQGIEAYLEIGPHPVLLGMGSACVGTDGALWLPSLKRGRGEWEQMLDTLASLYAKGVPVDWAGFDGGYARRRVSLSTYPFQRSRHWIPVRERSPLAEPLPAARAAAEADDRIGRMLFEVAWVPTSEPRSSEGSAAGLASPQAIEATIAGEPQALYERHGLAQFEAFLPQLDGLCGAYVVQALRRLGWVFTPGATVTEAGVAERCGVLPRHRRLLGRLLEMLQEDGILERAPNGWRVRVTPGVVDTLERTRLLLAQYPAQDAELGLTARCGEQLAEVLRGRADPLQLLFPDGSLSDTERLYKESPIARAYNTLVQKAFCAAVATLPKDAPLRVLEIGAGTGGTTSSLLPHVPAERTEYWFTDVSRVFAARAREQFRDYRFLRFADLDIGASPAAQGFQRATFDLIVAANVLHATPDLRRTLEHVRELLAPGGLLLLLEASSPERYADLTVGLTEGWWAFSDADLRPAYALLPRDRWLQLLQRCGFAAAAAVPGADARGVLARQSVIVAQAGSAAESVRPRFALFADAGGTAAGLARSLAASHEAVCVRVGERFARDADGSYAIDPRSPDDYRRVLDEIFAASGTVPAGVAHFWSLDAAMPAQLSSASLEASQRAATASVLLLAQALATRAAGAVPLTVVTRGAQVTDAKEAARAALPQAPVWGLCHTIALEHPELRCRRIDLDPARLAGEAEEAEQLRRELCARDAEDQVARRGAQRLGRRLKPSRLGRVDRPVRFAASATYLITGGLRGLGPVIARWMADRGARHLVLFGRSGVGAEAKTVIDELAGRGVEVRALSADVAEHDQVAGVLAQLDSMPRLRGVIHSAGVVDDAALLQQTWAHLDRVMAAKVRGAWHLSGAAEQRQLDFLALFSTGASLVGSPGQANHAAANAFVDVLAPALRARGVPAVAINWGAWADVGAAVGRKLSADRHGVERMAPADGLAAFERVIAPLLAGDATAPAQVAALATDWAKFFEQFGANDEPPLFAEIARVERQRTPTAPSVAQAERSFLRELTEAPPGRRLSMLRTHAQREAAKVLGLADHAEVGVQQPLRDLGLDSLMAVQLRNRLAASLEHPLPATLLFECPTVKALAEFLLDAAQLGGAGAGPEPAASVSFGSAHATEDDIAARLLARLDQIGQRQR